VRGQPGSQGTYRFLVSSSLHLVSKPTRVPHTLRLPTKEGVSQSGREVAAVKLSLENMGECPAMMSIFIAGVFSSPRVVRPKSRVAIFTIGI
jgi:hypothetical protein